MAEDSSQLGCRCMWATNPCPLLTLVNLHCCHSNKRANVYQRTCSIPPLPFSYVDLGKLPSLYESPRRLIIAPTYRRWRALTSKNLARDSYDDHFPHRADKLGTLHSAHSVPVSPLKPPRDRCNAFSIDHDFYPCLLKLLLLYW